MNTISHASDNGSPIVNVVESSLEDDCLSITLKNNSSKDIYLANWDLMKSGELTKDVFVISSKDGTQFAYKGKVVKRAEPSVDDLQVIKPGQSYAIKVDLSEYYDLSSEISKVIYDATLPVYEVNDNVVQVADFETIESKLYEKE